MNRIMIIGCCGAGKSTLAAKLHKILGLELIHLDQHYWQPEWTETSQDEWLPIVEKLVQKDKWIIDGNYGSSMEIRIKRADTIIWLDYSTSKCLSRVIKRVWKYHGKERPDMPSGCRERFDADFLLYVATFKWNKYPAIKKRLSRLNENQQLYIFKNDSETNEFLKNLQTSILYE